MNITPLRPDRQPGGIKKLLGNRARIDPRQPVTGQNVTNPAVRAAFPHGAGEDAGAAERARAFSEENKL